MVVPGTTWPEVNVVAGMETFWLAVVGVMTTSVVCGTPGVLTTAGMVVPGVTSLLIKVCGTMTVPLWTVVAGNAVPGIVVPGMKVGAVKVVPGITTGVVCGTTGTIGTVVFWNGAPVRVTGVLTGVLTVCWVTAVPGTIGVTGVTGTTEVCGFSRVVFPNGMPVVNGPWAGAVVVLGTAVVSRTTVVPPTTLPPVIVVPPITVVPCGWGGLTLVPPITVPPVIVVPPITVVPGAVVATGRVWTTVVPRTTVPPVMVVPPVTRVSGTLVVPTAWVTVVPPMTVALVMVVPPMTVVRKVCCGGVSVRTLVRSPVMVWAVPLVNGALVIVWTGVIGVPLLLVITVFTSVKSVILPVVWFWPTVVLKRSVINGF